MIKQTIAILIISLLLSLTCAYSQSKFGEVSKNELEMTSYPNDTAASAVILLKEGETRFVYDEASDFFRYEYTLKMKIKILKEDGLDWCNNEVGYFEWDRLNKEEVKGLSGTTYNLENDKIIKTKLSKEYIFDEDINKTYKLKKFTLPGAKVGSVVEFKYTLLSKSFRDLRNFYFQAAIPTVKVSYNIYIPEYFRYNVNMQGYEHIETARKPENGSFFIRYRDNFGRSQTERMSCTVEAMEFRGSGIPALKFEPYVWCLSDYRTMVSFELKSFQLPYGMLQTYSSSWDNIDKQLMESDRFGENLKKTNLFKNDVSKMEPNLNNASTVLNMIKSKYKWNEESSMYPSDFKDVLKDGMANSSGVNFMLINALKAAGFEAYPVVLSTRENGRIPMANPSVSSFNYTITALKLDAVLYYTDASDKYGDWNILPKKCMVDKARVLVDKTYAFWADLSAVSQAKIVITGDISFDESGKKVKYISSLSDIAARDYRENYFKFKDEDAFLEDLAEKEKGQILDFEAQELENTGRPVKYQYVLEQEMSTGGDIMYINPIVDRVIPKNLFVEEMRKFPVNFDRPVNYVQIVKVFIPEGYAVEELPKSEKLVTSNNDIQLLYQIGVVGNAINLNYRFRINKLMFLQTDYDMLKDFFSKAVSKNSEQIVLKKISE